MWESGEGGLKVEGWKFITIGQFINLPLVKAKINVAENIRKHKGI